MAHARLSPSAAHRWRLCPGSVREEAKFPEPPSGPAAIDGTHSHTLLEHCITEDVNPITMVGQVLSDDDGSFVVDEERAKRVQVATDYIRSRSPIALLAETTVDPFLLTGRSDLGGTADIQILSDDLLEVIDYKDGMGAVEAQENPQLEQYAIGALAGMSQHPSRVRMTIIQPKLALKGMNPISSHEVDTADLLGRKLVKLVADAEATERPDAPLVPGESQCKFCRAAGPCAARASHVMKEVGVMFQPVETATLDVAQQSADKDPATMSNDQLRQIIEAAPLLRQMLEGAEKEAQRRMEQGQSIPGLKLVNGRGSRAWSIPEEEIAEKLIRMGAPKGVVYETKIVSPAKAEKMVWTNRKGEKKQLSERQLKTLEQEYITKMAGKLTIAPESDSRPAVITNAAPMFGAVESPVELPAWLS